jgi:siroheme synthase
MMQNVRLGSVCLVGAGPGDPELMTLKGVNRLGAADVVVYDELVAKEQLERFALQARWIGVGKRKGCHLWKQEAINALLVSLAEAGHSVVRLKGGILVSSVALKKNASPSPKRVFPAKSSPVFPILPPHLRRRASS